MSQTQTRAPRAATGLGLALAVLAGALGACQTGASGTPAGVRPETALQVGAAHEDLNDRLARVAAASHDLRGGAADYRVGPGDVLEIDVFQAEELDRTVRVRPDGTISLPLLGSLQAAGTTTTELERALAERLGSDYLWSPQVSVFVKEYRAHPVSVLGEVNEPGVFYLQEPRSLVEMLSEAGGLTEDASTTVHLRRQVPGLDAGQLELELLMIDLRGLVEQQGQGPDLLLQDGDTVYVPKAGVVFVEGSVEKPGVYALKGEATVVKAIAMAGGLTFEASKSGVQLIRGGPSQSEVLELDLAEITASPRKDVSLRDGDVVLVGSSPVKIGLAGLWRGIATMVNLSMGL